MTFKNLHKNHGIHGGAGLSGEYLALDCHNNHCYLQKQCRHTGKESSMNKQICKGRKFRDFRENKHKCGIDHR